MTCRCARGMCAAFLRTPLRIIAASSAVGGLPRHLRMRTKIRLLTTSHRVWICLRQRLNPPFHAPPRTTRRSPLSVYRPGGHPHATRVWHRRRPVHINVSYLALELRCAAHARLVAPSLAIPLRARLSVGRSAAGPEARAHGGPESDPSPPAQAPKPEGQVAVFPSVRGGARRDARERPPTAPSGSAWFPGVTTPAD
jgi:hypothetical protein